MRRSGWLVVAIGGALVAACAVAVRSGRVPLGVPHEWEWQRIAMAPTGPAVGVGVVGVLGLSAFAAAGSRALARSSGAWREAVWLAGLVVASVLAQAMVQEGAPEVYGLSKWIVALHNSGSSGYYTTAKEQMGDPRKFVADYPEWIEKQDPLHIGTHPPGLFLIARGLLGAMEARPDAARWVLKLAPPSVADAAVAFRETHRLARADAASLTLTGALTLLACASTVVPLYLLARSGLPASPAWASAALWPLVPSALMFQPTADTAFPLLSTTALALASWSTRSEGTRGAWLSALSGLTMALGMLFTLAFLPVGLVVATILLSSPGRGWSGRIVLVVATGIGFLAGTLAWWAATSANPFAIWWANQRNHARFYVVSPKSYLPWLLVNPIELAVALGLPATLWAIVGLRRPTRAAWATLAVLVVLTVSGKNLSEVARLWLPLMPPLLVAAGAGFDRLGARAGPLAGSIALMGVQALILEATIQVVYPF